MDKTNKYKIIQESASELKNFRIKLIELFILSLSAVFVLLTFSHKKAFLIPAAIIVVDILWLIIVLTRGANCENVDVIFDKNNALVTTIEMKRVTYEMTLAEQFSLGLYAIAIILMCVVMFMD